MVEEFFSKLDKLITSKSRPMAQGCIEWTGKLTKSGYGSVQLTLPGASQHNRLHTTAHRAAYMLKNKVLHLTKINEQGKTLEISHLCHCPYCVNPEHLTLETHATNVERRMCKNGRICIGHMPECMVEVSFVALIIIYL